MKHSIRTDRKENGMIYEAFYKDRQERNRKNPNPYRQIENKQGEIRNGG